MMNWVSVVFGWINWLFLYQNTEQIRQKEKQNYWKITKNNQFCSHFHHKILIHETELNPNEKQSESWKKHWINKLHCDLGNRNDFLTKIDFGQENLLLKRMSVLQCLVFDVFSVPNSQTYNETKDIEMENKRQIRCKTKIEIAFYSATVVVVVLQFVIAQ